jgi:transcriptional regulator with XRE-family HTH domain
LNPEKAFGDVLRAVRRERKLSQEALALDAGVERNYVSLLELGKNSASIRMLFKLCSALDITPSNFVRRVEMRLKPEVA